MPRHYHPFKGKGLEEMATVIKLKNGLLATKKLDLKDRLTRKGKNSADFRSYKS